MDEGFEGKRCGGMYVGNLLQREFACKHYLRISRRLKKPCALRCAVIHLGRSMEGYRRQVERKEGKVLGYKGIDTCIIKFANKAFDSRNLIVIQNGVERNVDPGIIKVGKAT